jgi:hypothetical protein
MWRRISLLMSWMMIGVRSFEILFATVGQMLVWAFMGFFGFGFWYWIGRDVFYCL